MRENTFTREFNFDRAKADEAKREIELSFASETLVERYFGFERLAIESSAIDFSRLNTNSAPLLWNHDTDQLIGTVRKAWIGPDKKARALVRFGNSTKAKEVWADIESEIIATVSVGYRVLNMVEDGTQDGTKVFRVTKWLPYELSVCPVPADEKVGVSRSAQNESKRKMNIEVGVNRTHEEIMGISDRLKGKVQGIDELSSRAVLENWDVETFRKQALSMLPTATPIQGTPGEPFDVKPKEWARYSLRKVIAAQIPNSNIRLDGMEAEFSQEISMKQKRKPEGVWVPAEAMAYGQRNYVAGTGTLGGMLVATDNLGSNFIELLRNRALVTKLGARVLNLNNPVTVPKQLAAGTVNWVTETAAATLSPGNFGQITLTPQGVSAFQQYSKQLLFESDPSIDALIRDDIMNIIALEIDRVVLHGTGSGQPTGITATTGTTTIALGANGAAFSVANGFDSMISLETAIATSNADVGNLAYITNAKVRGKLKRIDENLATNSARWVWRTEAGQQVVNGYAAHVTNQVSAIQTQGTATTIASSTYFGNWNDVLIASFNNGATDILVDPYSLGANAIVKIIARHWTDLAFRNPQSFAVLLGILAG
jgi:HK97 family phage major capsid protein/HK97 family phage prohead protease